MSRDFWTLCFFFDILCAVSTGQSESRSNGGPTKGFHPQLVWDHITWPLDFVFFCNLCTVLTGQIESRSNGGSAKGFHPQLVLDHITWLLDFVFFFDILCMVSKVTWVPVKWWSRKGFSFTTCVGSWHVTFGLCVFYILCVVTTCQCESQSNGRLVKDFHPCHMIFGVCDFWSLWFFYILLRSQIKLGHLWKSWVRGKSWTGVFQCPAFSQVF